MGSVRLGLLSCTREIGRRQSIYFVGVANAFFSGLQKGLLAIPTANRHLHADFESQGGGTTNLPAYLDQLGFTCKTRENGCLL